MTNYLIYTKITDSPQSFSNREIVPYQDSGWGIWKQIKVLKNIIFGSPQISVFKQKEIARELNSSENIVVQKPMDMAKQAKSVNFYAKRDDAFCDQEKINKQRVFEGRTINVLYDYAPIGTGAKRLHFLLTPKEHRSRFSDLTQDEYLEANLLAQKIIRFYMGKDKEYHSAYLFNKTGLEAGQTQPHWHEHLIFTTTEQNDLIGRFSIFKRMLLGSTPLPPDVLNDRVSALNKELSPVLKESEI